MMCWPLLYYSDPSVTIRIGAPPPPVPTTYVRHRYEMKIDDNPVIKSMTWLERDMYAITKWHKEEKYKEIPPAHCPVMSPRPDHELPAAYELWRRLAQEASERAMLWDEDEFQMRRRRAAVLCEIQFEQVYKWLLDNALDEIHRQNELVEMSKIAARQGEERDEVIQEHERDEVIQEHERDEVIQESEGDETIQE